MTLPRRISGATTAGEYVNTLNVTDICTGWTEPVAVLNKAQRHVFAGLMDVEQRQPFPFAGIDSDNGAEFQNPLLLETDLNGERRCRIFYCDPMASWQKGRIEKSHEFIRYVLPKGSSFDGLSQDDVDLLMNHINCTCRDVLGSSCPFDLACSTMADVIAILQLYRVPANQIHLKPDLLKQ